jgi:general secretion pathway protein H
MRAPRQERRGLTLVELTIALAVAALATAIAIGAVNSLTSASLHSTAVELTGAVKTCYDRAIMERRIERLSIDMEKNLWWIDYTEEQFSLAAERVKGREGDHEDSDEKSGGSGKKKKAVVGNVDKTKGGAAGEIIANIAGKAEERLGKSQKGKSKSDDSTDKQPKSIFDEGDKDAQKNEVKLAMEGGKAINFQLDAEVSKPRPIPSNVKVTRVWAGHQEEAFTNGIARIHFFNIGFSEPAQIEMTDGSDYVTIKVYPLTGRVRTYPRQIEVPKTDHDDAKEEDTE